VSVHFRSLKKRQEEKAKLEKEMKLLSEDLAFVEVSSSTHTHLSLSAPLSP
jgi:hypothetical protein